MAGPRTQVERQGSTHLTDVLLRDEPLTLLRPMVVLRIRSLSRACLDEGGTNERASERVGGSAAACDMPLGLGRLASVERARPPSTLSADSSET